MIPWHRSVLSFLKNRRLVTPSEQIVVPDRWYPMPHESGGQCSH
jgi:hypothetical protein